MAMSEWPEISGATSGSNAVQFRGQVHVHVREHGGRESDQAVRSARPRPFSVSRSHCASGISAASRAAICGVPSVLALSAMVIRNG